MRERMPKAVFVLLMAAWIIQVIGQLIFLVTSDVTGPRVLLAWVLLLVAVVGMLITVRWHTKRAADSEPMSR